MKRKRNEFTANATELASQPFYYEIRVKGHLTEERWTEWFDNLTISTAKGESILRGVVPDHAALYALLARLRDLAIPLLAVNVLDAEAQRKLFKQSRRYTLATNLTLLLVYLILLGSMVAITTYLTADQIVHTTLALAILFAAVGGLAYAFAIWSGLKAWLWITYAVGPVSILTFLIFTSETRILNSSLVVSIILLLSAGGLLYLVYYLRGHADQINEVIAGWKALRAPKRSTSTVDSKEPQ